MGRGRRRAVRVRGRQAGRGPGSAGLSACEIKRVHVTVFSDCAWRLHV